jgi:hypothetical protein
VREDRVEGYGGHLDDLDQEFLMGFVRDFERVAGGLQERSISTSIEL